MKLLYCSCICSEKTYAELYGTSKQKPGQQVQKYNRLLLKGLAQQPDVKVEALSKTPVNSKVVEKKFIGLKDEYWEKTKIHYFPTANIRGLNNLLQIIFAFAAIFKQKKKDNPIILLDVLNISLGIGIILACKIKKFKVIGIVTDLPEFLTNDSNGIFVKQCRKIIEKCNAYVLLTKEMNDSVNPNKEKPYIVIEGQVDSSLKQKGRLLGNDHGKRVCVYSGSLNRDNGIEYMVKGFIKANIDNAELHIYGSGDYEKELIGICKECNKVKYHGVKLNDEVVKAQTEASLLINPRPTNQEFTKYSFPSKNMEYMASGTPVLTTKLPGMPKEYYPYVYLIDEESVDGICRAFTEILSKPQSELDDRGRKAKKFVMENKTEIVQAKKIIDMIKESGLGCG